MVVDLWASHFCSAQLLSLGCWVDGVGSMEGESHTAPWTPLQEGRAKNVINALIMQNERICMIYLTVPIFLLHPVTGHRAVVCRAKEPPAHPLEIYLAASSLASEIKRMCCIFFYWPQGLETLTKMKLDSECNTPFSHVERWYMCHSGWRFCGVAHFRVSRRFVGPCASAEEPWIKSLG